MRKTMMMAVPFLNNCKNYRKKFLIRIKTALKIPIATGATMFGTLKIATYLVRRRNVKIFFIPIEISELKILLISQFVLIWKNVMTVEIAIILTSFFIRDILAIA